MNSNSESAKDFKLDRSKEGAASGTTSDKEVVQQVEGSGSDAENNVANVDSPAPAPDSSTAARVPFTSLSQVDSDMALARALQEQERAYFLLQTGHGGGGFNDTDRFYYEGDHFDIPGDEENQDEEGKEEEEDEEDEDEEEEEVEEREDDPEEAGVEERAANDDEVDGANFDCDEAFARALQDKEDRDTTARLMALAGIYDIDGEFENDSNDSQEGTWEDVDPDNMSYEELIALGEAVGTESKGLNSQSIAALQQFTYVSDSKDNTSDQEQCVVCRLEYEDGDKMLSLPCKHQYHFECIRQWLERNKVCPVCSAEVMSESSTSEIKS
ncbi:hypothetical protein KC19_VG010700 [Ceratodon purpureus]|uniref:RING-type domain-containing protein n=1 Tax=Ceratodon purpureus TaxID=3225 RepID=A0A8T0HKU9_CERPU|nr:hypothetical protein KC19_VG010700 [Ceratodon purpureus]